VKTVEYPDLSLGPCGESILQFNVVAIGEFKTRDISNGGADFSAAHLRELLTFVEHFQNHQTHWSVL
jgi:hypothetical protein